MGVQTCAKALLPRQPAGARDFKPTDQQLEVKKLLEERLATSQSQFDALRARDLPALNELLRQRKVPHIITTEVR